MTIETKRPTNPQERLLYDLNVAESGLDKIQVADLVSSNDPTCLSKAARMLQAKARLSQFVSNKWQELDQATSPQLGPEILPQGVLSGDDVVVAVEEKGSLGQTELILRTRAARAFDEIISNVPSPVLDELARQLKGNVNLAQSEFKDLAKLVIASREGRLKVPQRLAFLGATTRTQKEEYVLRFIQSFIASSLVLEISEPVKRGLMWRMAREVNRLVHLTGSQDGQEIVLRVIDNLPPAQRILVYRAMSTNLKHILEYPDIDECDPIQLAEYLNRAVQGRPRGITNDKVSGQISYEVNGEQIDRFTSLMEAIIERHDRGNINAGKIVDRLITTRDTRVFNLMIRAAELSGCLDKLYELFQTHPATTILARRVFRILRDGEEENTGSLEQLMS